MGKLDRLLITGSSGFVGRHLTEFALKKGYEVVGFDTRPGMDGVETVVGDIRDTGLVKKAMKNVDAVIHLAAKTSNIEFEENLKECYDVNVNGFFNVIESAKQEGCKRILYASSSAVYSREAGFSEESIIDIKKQANHYAKTKLINEMTADSYSLEDDIWLTGMRFFNVYGKWENAKGNYASIISRFIECKKQGKKLVIYGDGSQARDFVHAEDLSKIIFMLFDSGKDRVYNIGTGTATPYKEIAEFIDKDNIEYVENPLRSYQYLTRSDNRNLLKSIGDYKFIEIKEGIRGLMKGGDGR